MELVLIVVAIVLGVGLPALVGAYIVKKGINEVIEWREQQKKEKESQDNAEL